MIDFERLIISRCDRARKFSSSDIADCQSRRRKFLLGSRKSTDNGLSPSISLLPFLSPFISRNLGAANDAAYLADGLADVTTKVASRHVARATYLFGRVLIHHARPLSVHIAMLDTEPMTNSIRLSALISQVLSYGTVLLRVLK